MVVLIVLNIILIIALIFLALYIINNKKDDAKIVCVNNGDIDDEEVCQDSDEIEYCEYKEKKKQTTERVFDGKIITDEEYQQMTKYKRSNISVLINEIDKEYERLKELNK